MDEQIHDLDEEIHDDLVLAILLAVDGHPEAARRLLDRPRARRVTPGSPRSPHRPGSAFAGDDPDGTGSTGSLP